MKQAKEELRLLIKQRSYEKKDVTLASGKKSDFYVDAKQTTLSAKGAFLTGRVMYAMLTNPELPQVMAVGGVTMGADPMVTAISIESFYKKNPIDAFIIRKESKGYGKNLMVEGRRFIPDGTHVAIIEDVVTTGGSLIKAINNAVREGLIVKRVLALVDRMEGGHENIANAGYNLEAVFIRDDITEG